MAGVTVPRDHSGGDGQFITNLGHISGRYKVKEKGRPEAPRIKILTKNALNELFLP